MKLCPECGANVEGLLCYCDCCGASLRQKEEFVHCSIYEMPECLYFDLLTREMVEALQPADPSAYAGFLSWVGIGMVCYPESLLSTGKVKKSLRYYGSEKRASLRLLVDYPSFVTADKPEKARLIAEELISGLEWLEQRMKKSGWDLSDYVSFAKAKLQGYLTELH